MFSARFGLLLKKARKQRNITRDQLARRGGVSTRLVAEMERGQRPNVSLESALRLMDAVGISIIAKASDGATAEMRNPLIAALEREARAEQRRRTWTGRYIHLHDEGEDPRSVKSKRKRLSAVSDVSQHAYLIATSASSRSKPSPLSRKKRSTKESSAPHAKRNILSGASRSR